MQAIPNQLPTLVPDGTSYPYMVMADQITELARLLALYRDHPAVRVFVMEIQAYWDKKLEARNDG
jgi:hypothetical protein